MRCRGASLRTYFYSKYDWLKAAAAKKLREAGYVVDRVVAIVDRQEDEEADKLMKNADLELVSLYKLDELI